MRLSLLYLNFYDISERKTLALDIIYIYINRHKSRPTETADKVSYKVRKFVSTNFSEIYA